MNAPSFEGPFDLLSLLATINEHDDGLFVCFTEDSLFVLGVGWDRSSRCYLIDTDTVEDLGASDLTLNGDLILLQKGLFSDTIKEIVEVACEVEGAGSELLTAFNYYYIHDAFLR